MKDGEIVNIGEASYTLIEQIGQGGSGIVWSARDAGSNLKVAIKIVEIALTKRKETPVDIKNRVVPNENYETIDLFDSPRLHKELSYCKEHHSDHIIRFINWGKVYYEQNEAYGFVMPLYKETLRTALKNESMSLQTKLEYILQLIEAVTTLHEDHIIHRDLKPENILINEDNLVLSDLGIAHFPEQNVTKKGERLGNWDYHAPEQDRNASMSITSAVDVYSLGLIISEILTGKRPAGERPPRISQYYPPLHELDAIIRDMMTFRPDSRPDIFQVKARILLALCKLKRKKELIYASKAIRSIDKNTDSHTRNTITNDLLLADSFLHVHNLSEWRRIDLNYHRHISYSATSPVINACICWTLLESCKNKFSYEANAYSKDFDTHTPSGNDEKAKEYESQIKQLRAYFESWSDSIGDDPCVIVHSRIEYYFMSCSNYHREEILSDISDKLPTIKRNLIDAPLFWIAAYIRTHYHEYWNFSSISTFGDFVYINHIESQDIEDPEFDNWRITNRDTEFARDVINTIKEKHVDISASYNDQNELGYLVFRSRSTFDTFVDEGCRILALSPLDLMDFRDIIREASFVNDQVILEVNIFEINDTLSLVSA